ncbi:MAG: ABC transporter permease [Anaerolineaceae bacterium]|nr:ABC transporter permease [Anaerolineaceae bacterium]
MINWINLFIAETMKQKRSLTIVVIALAPILMFIFNFMIGLGGYYGTKAYGSEIVDTVINNSLNLWALIMLPMALSLLAALNANVEFRNNQWKQIYAFPVPTWKIMTVKWVINVAMSAMAHIFHLVLMLAAAFVLVTLNGHSFVGAMDYVYVFQHILVIFLASIMIVTIQTILALVFDNFLLVMALGTGLMISNYFVAQSSYGYLSPWSHPMRLNRFMSEDPYFWPLLVINIFGSLILAYVAFILLKKRQITA